MCGIAGYFGYQKNQPNFGQIKKCLNLMKNRGPDFQGFNKFSFENKVSIMLHSRLSIIDPEIRANQPFEDESGILSFNGEIYNYLELKKNYKLNQLKTGSDTEVLLKYLNKFSLPKEDLDGMWSYAYFDKKKRELILCRDRFGEKPLYFLYHNSNYYYGSNISYIFALSGINKNLNEEKILSFISYGFKSLFLNNKTFFSEIKNIESSSALIINNQLNLKKKFIWRKITHIETDNSFYNEKKIQLKSLLIETFSKRFRSDFPMACLLSGGIDSSAIVGLAKTINNIDLNCFSIKTDDKNYDESERINSLCKSFNLKPNYVRLNKINNYDFLEKIISDTYYPLSSISYLVYAHLNKAVKEKNFRVLLTGIGGDEIFAGYYTHHMNYLVQSFKNRKNFKNIFSTWKKFTKPLVRSKILSDFDYYRKQLKKKLPSFHEKEEISKFVKKKKELKVKEKIFCKKNFFRNQLSKDLFRDTVPPQILSADQVSMHFSIENRTPFLSHELFKFSNSISDECLIRNGFGKAILRDALSEFLPESIINFREKIGFYANINKLFHTNSKKFKDQLFQSNYINSLINVNQVNKLLQKDYMNNAESKFIFCILNLAILSNLK